MSRTHLKIAGPVIALLVVTAFTGCGSDEGTAFAELSIAEIEQAVQTDMADLVTVAMAGTLSRDGQTIELSVRATTDGSCHGTLTAGGVTAEILRAPDGGNFMRGDRAFWRAATGLDAVSARVGTKWGKLGSTDEFAEFCDVDRLLQELRRDRSTDEGTDEGTASKGAVTTLDGEDVLEVHNEVDGRTITALVLTQAPHYVVKVTSQGPETGEFTFSRFNEDFDITTPAPQEYVDLG